MNYQEYLYVECFFPTLQDLSVFFFDQQAFLVVGIGEDYNSLLMVYELNLNL